MSVRLYSRGKSWWYDIRFTWPEGGRVRERGKCPPAGKDAARRWAEARERAMFVEGKATYQPLAVKQDAAPAPACITLAEFWPRVVRDHYEANRLKPSSIAEAKRHFRLYLNPILGTRPLDKINPAAIAEVKGVMAKRSPKYCNNVLGTLSRVLGLAVKWDLIVKRPEMGMLKVAENEARWYELHDFRRLVEAARRVGTAQLVLVLLGGSAGLRRGELRALKWSDIDTARGVINIRRSFWQGVEGLPKGGKPRKVPMTAELAAALKAHRHLGERVLFSPNGDLLSNRTARNWLRTCQRRAGLPLEGKAKREKDRGGALHILRHTFCSHLAISGAPAKAIQELAGHEDLKTTLRYMHLSPANRSAAIETLSAFYATPVTTLDAVETA